MTRTHGPSGRRRPVQPELGEQLGQLPLDLPGVAGRVLGLDRQPDRPAVVDHRGQQVRAA